MFGRKKPTKLEDPLMVAFFDAEGALNVQIDPEQVPNGNAAGMILADFARHFQNMLVDVGKENSHSTALAAIERGFRAEIDDPTDDPSGKVEN